MRPDPGDADDGARRWRARDRRQHDLSGGPPDVRLLPLVELPRRPLVDALQRTDRMADLREVTGQQTIHSGFTKQDRSRFLGALENEIQAIKRRIGTGAVPSNELKP